jgi:hypothetical protein
MDNNPTAKITLNRLLDERRYVSTDTEDFFEKTRDLTPEEYSKEFEKTVNGHLGFSRIAPLKRAAGSGGSD